MLKYLSFFVITFAVCIPAIRSDVREASFSSFCNAPPPVEIDDSKTGSGRLTYREQMKQSWIVKLNVEREDGIIIEVGPFNLVNSFLVIREVSTSGDSGFIQFISGRQSKKFQFFIPYTKAFYMEKCPEENDDGEGDFTVEYKRTVPDYGYGPLPTEPPAVEIERQSVEIQFKGKKLQEYENGLFVQTFKDAVKSIARDYCAKANISFAEEKPANEMVTIQNIHRCPPEWSDTEICASVAHSVFVSGDDDSRARYIWKYELMRIHLLEMWKSANNKYLERIGLTVYEPPDRFAVTGWWLSIIVLPFVLLVCFLFLLRLTYKHMFENIQHVSSMSIRTTDVETRTRNKLKPNKFQQLPSFVKEDTRMGGDDAKDGGISQTEQKNYCAALLFPRFRLMEGIPE